MLAVADDIATVRAGKYACGGARDDLDARSRGETRVLVCRVSFVISRAFFVEIIIVIFPERADEVRELDAGFRRFLDLGDLDFLFGLGNVQVTDRHLVQRSDFKIISRIYIRCGGFYLSEITN